MTALHDVKHAHFTRALDLQAAKDGALGVLFAKLRTQPHIFSAYTRTAPLRAGAIVSELQLRVAPLQVQVRGS